MTKKTQYYNDPARGEKPIFVGSNEGLALVHDLVAENAALLRHDERLSKELLTLDNDLVKIQGACNKWKACFWGSLTLLAFSLSANAVTVFVK